MFRVRQEFECEVPFDAPVENVRALVDAAKKCSVYRK